MFDKKTEIAVSISAIFIITFIAFSPSLKNKFVTWDDQAYIAENNSIRQLSIENVKKIFTSAYVSNYQPLSIFTYALEYHFFKLDPRFYHATNVLLHLLNCLLVFWIIMLISGRTSVSLITALLFGLHPLRVESVTWVAERKDVLYAFFFLCSLVSYLYYVKRQSIKYYYCSLLLFLFSILSKAMAVTLPIVFFVFDYLLNRKFNRKLFIEKAPFLLLALIFGIIAFIIQRSDGAAANISCLVLLYQMQIAFYGLMSYLNKLLLPIDLSAIYPYPARGHLFNVMSLLSVAAISILGCVIFFSKRFTKKIVFGSLFSLITILPVLQIIPVGMFFMADRYSYIPSIGIAYIFSEGFVWLYSRKYKYESALKLAQNIILLALISMLTFLTYERTKIWKDDIVLWNDALKGRPESTSANYYLGKAYNDRGDFEKAAAYLSKALEFRINRPIVPVISNAYFELGNSYNGKGDLDKAIYNYGRAIEIKPNNIEAYTNRGVAYEKKGDLEQAISDHTKAIELSHNNDMAYYNRGNAYLLRGSFDQAILDYDKAIQINPSHVGAYNNRANAYLSKQEYDKAWDDVHKMEALGAKVNPNLLEDLKKASGR